MKIIAGLYRGLSLNGLEGDAVRPTLSRVKEDLFNILQEVVPGSRVLDLYAGSGSLGLEALSRGAAQVTCVDASKEVEALIKSNVARLKAEDQQRVRIVRCDAQAFVRRLKESKSLYDLVFIDPPYSQLNCNVIVQLLSWEILSPGGIIILEHDRKADLKELKTNAEIDLFRTKEFKHTQLSFIRAASK